MQMDKDDFFLNVYFIAVWWLNGWNLIVQQTKKSTKKKIQESHDGNSDVESLRVGFSTKRTRPDSWGMPFWRYKVVEWRRPTHRIALAFHSPLWRGKSDHPKPPMEVISAVHQQHHRMGQNERISLFNFLVHWSTEQSITRGEKVQQQHRNHIAWSTSLSFFPLFFIFKSRLRNVLIICGLSLSLLFSFPILFSRHFFTVARLPIAPHLVVLSNLLTFSTADGPHLITIDTVGRKLWVCAVFYLLIHSLF